jgi:hypothetical protein
MITTSQTCLLTDFDFDVSTWFCCLDFQPELPYLRACVNPAVHSIYSLWISYHPSTHDVKSLITWVYHRTWSAVWNSLPADLRQPTASSPSTSYRRTLLALPSRLFPAHLSAYLFIRSDPHRWSSGSTTPSCQLMCSVSRIVPVAVCSSTSLNSLIACLPMNCRDWTWTYAWVCSCRNVWNIVCNCPFSTELTRTPAAAAAAAADDDEEDEDAQSSRVYCCLHAATVLCWSRDALSHNEYSLVLSVLLGLIANLLLIHTRP